MTRLKTSLPLIVLLGLGTILWRGLALQHHYLPASLLNKSLPTFQVPEIEHRNKTLSSKQMKGKVSLINVWASWCRNCYDELPLLHRIKQAGVALYGLNYKDDWDDAKTWLQRFGNPYLATGYDGDGSVGVELGVYGTPEIFIIDKKGTIRYKYLGTLTKSAWRHELLPIVKRLQHETS